MKPEMLELVLQEILQEQKETNLVNGQLAGYIKSLTEKMDSIEEKIGKQDKSADSDRVKSLEKLQGYLTDIKLAIVSKPTNVTHKKIFQLFPSLNIREYYQVYGNIVKWLALFGVACLAIRLIRDLLEKQGFL